jgi:hypothetical protein
MKKVLLLAVLILLSLNSCKKEKEGLAKFVIGEWKSQELTLLTQSEGQQSPVGHFTISIKEDNTYVLIFRDLVTNMGFGCGDDTYTITGDEIYLKEFTSDPLWGDPRITATFSVTWVPGETQMIWSEFATLPALVWTKQ